MVKFDVIMHPITEKYCKFILKEIAFFFLRKIRGLYSSRSLSQVNAQGVTRMKLSKGCV